MRIIVVDDFGSMRKVVKRALMSLGFEDIVEARHGKDAYDILITNHDIKEKRIDLGLIDWNMPIMSGLQLLQKIRSDKRISDFSFIMLTAENSQDNIVLAVQNGVDEYIIKPFEHAILQEKLVKLARKRIAEVEQEIKSFFPSDQVDLKELKDTGDDDFEGLECLDSFVARLEKINKLIPWSYVGPYALGRAYFKFEKYSDAEISLRKALAINFGVVEAHRLLSVALKKLGKVPESIEELEIAVREKPRDSRLKRNLGDAYLRKGELDKAIQVLTEAILHIKPDDTKSLAGNNQSLGKARVEKGDEINDQSLKEEGLANIQQAVKQNPDVISAHYDLMVAYKKSGRTKEALGVLEYVKSVEPKDAEGWVALGKVYLEQSEKSKALFSFKKAEALSEKKYLIFEEIASMLYKHQFHDEAIEFLDLATESDPTNIWPYNMKGIIFRRKKLYEKAIKEYTAASQLDPNDANIFFNLGMAYVKNDQRDKCVSFFNKAKELDPSLESEIPQVQTKTK